MKDGYTTYGGALKDMLQEMKVFKKTLDNMELPRSDRFGLSKALEHLRLTMYYVEDLVENLSEKSHWKTIMKFQKEVHRI